MRIILNEMKKIWNIKIILLIIFSSLVVYNMFMSFNINYFFSNHPEQECYVFAMEMTKKYGKRIEQKEFDQFIKEKKLLLNQEFIQSIANESILTDNGIYTFDDMYLFFNAEGNRHIQLEKLNGDEEKLQLMSDSKCRIYGKEYDYIGFKFQTIMHIENDYLNAEKYIDYDISSQDTGPKSITRLQEIKDTKQYKNISINETRIINRIQPYFFFGSIVIMLGVIILISPLITTDNLRNMSLLQYTSKKGRKLLSHQLIACLISTFILVTLKVLIFGGIFSTLGTQVFWNNAFNAFYNHSYSTFDFTYGQWILMQVGLLYLLAFVLTFIVFVISKMSKNYITLILKGIPIFTVFVFICMRIFDKPFFMKNPLYRFTQIVGIELIVTLLLIALGIVGYVALYKKNGVMDIH